jgi:hypothetical protein
MKKIAARKSVADPFRAAIRLALARSSRTANWLSHRQTGHHPQTVQKYLYTGTNGRILMVAEMFHILGIKIEVPGE